MSTGDTLYTGQKKRLGELLIAEGRLTHEQLDQAMAVQQADGGFLGQILVKLGFVSQEHVTAVLVKECKIPHLSLLDYDISSEVLTLLPEELCLQRHLLPIDKLGRILTVAMVNPLDVDALNEVRQVCPDLRIKPILCNWAHFELVTKKAFRSKAAPMTAQSFGLSTSPAARAAQEASASAAVHPAVAEVSAAEAVAAVTQGLAERGGTHVPLPNAAVPNRDFAPQQAAPAMNPADVARMVRDGVAEGVRMGLAAAHDADPASMRETQWREMCQSLQRSLFDAVRAAAPSQSGHADFSRIEALLQGTLESVQETSRLVESSLVKEQTRRDLSTGRQPVQRFGIGAGPTEQEEAVAAADEAVLAALESDLPVESYRFDNFVPGHSNAFAVKVCEAVAREPGGRYNPLFLYGRVGIGKTHLVCAIGNHAGRGEQVRRRRVGYLSASQFARRLNAAMREDALEVFRAHYGHWDMLILDDIQFLGGKVEAQEEFFHIFNVLQQQQRQVIIVGDKPPDKLGLLEQRLISRFGSGMVAELKAPDYEARLGILRSLVPPAQQPPPEVLSMIAMRIADDMRTMAGALRKILAYAELAEREVTCDMAGEVLNQLRGEDAA